MRHPNSVVLSSETLSYDKTDRTMSGFASDLRFNGSNYMYDDACDIGIWIKSHKTGRIEPFVLLKAERDADGDVRWWTFANTKLNLILTVWNT